MKATFPRKEIFLDVVRGKLKLQSFLRADKSRWEYLDLRKAGGESEVPFSHKNKLMLPNNKPMLGDISIELPQHRLDTFLRVCHSLGSSFS